MSDFLLPDVGEGLEQAEIVEWLVAVGDTVKRDQPLVEILTDKSQTQLPSPIGGVVTALGGNVGDIIDVGALVVSYEGSVEAEAPTTAITTPSTIRRPKASPAVRKRALRAGIALDAVPGTGPGGRITADDLDKHLTRPAKPQLPVPAQPRVPSDLGHMAPGTHPLRGIRRVTAAAMERSWQIPHIHGHDEFDASPLLHARSDIKQRHPDLAARLTPLAFFVMAVAESLRTYPTVNASIDTDAQTVTVHPGINIGIAVAAPQGLIVPVIADADQRGLFDLAGEIARLSSLARDGAITTADMSDGTCTVTNYGSLGGRHATPIIRAPEAAIVGFGSIRERPIAVGGQVVARPTLPIAVGVDHRLIDGDLMTAFQERIIASLGNPAVMLAR
ncbi:MAG: 2-oxo acid dehydrogenase subunit E2 [Actinomycetia bacterium]|nr:2-oxo acid dehydrogenase subunit E2 [Actinomycetes bacterium]MCP4959388.1 2-oxo acid dehydrogenase subunit E2 [Actinomycetes bacterium]